MIEQGRAVLIDPLPEVVRPGAGKRNTRMAIPTHRCLQALPEVFTPNALATMLGGDKRAAAMCLARWRRTGRIASIGLRIRLYFNLVRNQHAPAHGLNEAIARVYPGAMIGRVSAVHAAGWTTQVPRRLEIVAPRQPNMPRLYEVSVSCRPRAWFAGARHHLERPGPLPMLRADFALADLVATGDWCPDPDDLEWDMIDVGRMRAVFAGQGVGLPPKWGGTWL